jgi:tetratricopeptide (TPR) repeat protein
MYDNVWALQGYAHQEDSLAAVGDSYLRRAQERFKANDPDGMAREAAKVFALDYYQYPSSRWVGDQQAMAHNLIGWAHAQRREFPQAEARFRAAIELDPMLAEAYGNMATALFDEGKKAEAKRWLEAGLKVAPNDPQLMTLRRKASD